MKQKISVKPLYAVSIFISIAAGCLAFGIAVVAQFTILKVIPHIFLLTDVLFALIIGGIVLTISIITIWLIAFLDNRYDNKIKALRIRFGLSCLLSSIPLLIGAFLMNL